MVKISPEAKEYIARKGGPITLTLPNAPNCCVSVPIEPQVEFLKPGALGKGIYGDRQYLLEKTDGVEIYVDTRIPDNADLTVALQGLFGRKWLAVEGWKLF